MIIVDPINFSNIPPALEESWDQLLAQSKTPSFQYTFAYQCAWVDCLRGRWRPLILLVREGQEIKGIFPLMYRDRKRRGIVPYREIRFLGCEVTDFSVVLARQEDLRTVVYAAVGWLFSGNFRWESLCLDDIPENYLAGEMIRQYLEAKRIPFALDVGKYYYVPLDRSWNEVWGATSKKFVRRNVNLARNRLAKSGPWRLLVDPGWDVRRIIEQAAAIHQVRQAELGRISVYSNPDYRHFVERVVGYNRDGGCFRSHWLEFNNELIAYLLGFEQNHKYYAWNMAFRPEFSEYYPSRLIFAEVIRECHEKKLGEFNFMRGEAEYKSKWTPYFRGNLRFTVRNKNNFYGRLVHALEGRVT